MDAGPFPGRNPHLEGTDFRRGFHSGYMHFTLKQLQPRLPENDVAILELRVYVDPRGWGGSERQAVLDLARTWTDALLREAGPRGAAHG